MPQLEVKTVAAQSVWRSPDGQREIFELQLEWEGKPVKAKTYSKDIAQAGWSGTVETYEKAGRNGSETFVKQPQKEGGGYGGGGGGGYRGGGGAKADPFTMYLSYAKDLAIASIEVAAKGNKFNGDLFQEMLGAVEAGGAQLYASRPDAPKQEGEAPAKPDTVVNSDEPITIADLGSALDGEPVDPGETPWPPTT